MGESIPSNASTAICEEESTVHPHNSHPSGYFPSQPGQVRAPRLPAWATTFRTVLLIGAGLLVLLLLFLIGTATLGPADMYSDGGLGVLQATIWLGFGTILLTFPYLIASIVYAGLWATKLRGRGYRPYTATSWILVVGPVVALPVVVSVALITADPSML